MLLGKWSAQCMSFSRDENSNSVSQRASAFQKLSFNPNLNKTWFQNRLSIQIYLNLVSGKLNQTIHMHFMCNFIIQHKEGGEGGWYLGTGGKLKKISIIHHWTLFLSMLQKHTLSQMHLQNRQQQLHEKHGFSTTKFAWHSDCPN